MAVKRSSSGGRMLGVFEALARTQPVGVSALARDMGADKSAVQRDLMTLADAGWIRPAPGLSGQWELSPRILTFARAPSSNEGLRQRAARVIEDLRAETGETAYLAIEDGDRFVVVSAAESHHPLRMVPAIGLVIPMEGSATARAVLPFLSGEELERRLAHAPTPERLAEFAATRDRGYAINDEEVVGGAVALASAILSGEGRPIGALVLTGPAERIAPDRRAGMGALLAEAARRLSADPA